MNKSYKSIWNPALSAWVAVSELTRAKGKRCSPAAVAVVLLTLVSGGASAACVSDGATVPTITCTGPVTGNQAVTISGTTLHQLAGSTWSGGRPGGTGLDQLNVQLDGTLTGAVYNFVNNTNSTLTLGSTARISRTLGGASFDGSNNTIVFNQGAVFDDRVADSISISGFNNRFTFAGTYQSSNNSNTSFNLGDGNLGVRGMRFTFADTGRIGSPDYTLSPAGGIQFVGNSTAANAGDVQATFGAGEIYTLATGVLVFGTVDSSYTFNGTRIMASPSGNGIDVGRASLQNTLTLNNATVSGGNVGIRVRDTANYTTLNLTGGSVTGGSGTSVDFSVTPAATVQSLSADGTSFSGSIVGGAGSETVTLANSPVTGMVSLGAGTDVLSLSNMSASQLALTSSLNGGAGNDTLNLSNSIFTSPSSRLINWESINLVQGSRLMVDGTLALGTDGGGPAQLSVNSGSTLGGTGTIGGSVAIGDGALSPGNSPGTLTIAGNLALSSGSQLNYELGAANTAGGALNDLTVVGGNLTLDGTLNVTQSAGGTYGAGIYRLIDYAGTLTDNGLELGSMPAGTDNYVQTSVAQQVNLVNSKGLTLNYWDGDAGAKNDGTIAGGNGTWVAGPLGSDRWTQADGQINAPYQDAAFAIFTGAPGIVTVDNGQGAVRVSGMQFATDGYRIEGGSIELTAGTNAIRVGDGTAAGAATTATIASALTGAGRLDKVDLGTLVLTGANTYTGGTAISGGTLQLGDGGTTGSIADGPIANAGTLAFNRADALNIDGAISGAGAVRQIGAGTTTLGGVNTYTGGTSVLAGTLVGSATSFGSGAIVNDAALVIAQPSDATLANAISGTGTLTKIGGGTLNLTGNSTLSGATTVAAGTLAVNGLLANSAVAVASGATLAGTGTVGATMLQAGATVAPGNNGIGTLNVNGAFTQAAGAMYQVQVQGGSNASDRVHAVGSASIGSGATLQVARTGGGGYSLDTRYTVLTADGGVNGTYSLTGDTRSAFMQLFDSYDANNVYLTAKQVRPFVTAGLTPNQIATAGGLDTIGAGPLRSAMAALPDDFAARAAFDQVSGEIHASIKTAALEDSRFVREAAVDRLRSAACAPGAASPQTDRERQPPVRDAQADGSGCAPAGSERVVWAQTFGSWGKTKGDGNAAEVQRDIGGFFVGADTSVGGGWRVGALAGYSRASADVDARGSASKTDSYHLGVYGGTQWGNTALRLGASHAWNQTDTTRAVAFSGYRDRLQADHNSTTTQVFGEVGHRIDIGQIALEPFAGLAYVNVKSDAFAERGGFAALQGAGGSTDATFATLGLRASAPLGERTRLRGTVGWRHAFGDTTPSSTHALPGSLPFTVYGVPVAKNVAVLEAGIETLLKPNLTLGASYAGQYGSGVVDHGFKLNLAWKF